MSSSFARSVSRHTLNLDLSAARHEAPVRLSGLLTDLFTIVIRIRETDSLGDPQALRKLITWYLDLFQKNGETASRNRGDILDAMYAVVALIDEAVLSSGGECREYWLGRPLQLDYFGEAMAGEEFFNRLEGVLKTPGEKSDVIEVYFLCLALGFEGRYKLTDRSRLSAYMKQCADALSKHTAFDTSLSPRALPRKKMQVPQTNSRMRMYIPFAAALLIATGLGIWLWGVISIRAAAANIIALLNTLRGVL